VNSIALVNKAVCAIVENKYVNLNQIKPGGETPLEKSTYVIVQKNNDSAKTIKLVAPGEVRLCIDTTRMIMAIPVTASNIAKQMSVSVFINLKVFWLLSAVYLVSKAEGSAYWQ